MSSFVYNDGSFEDTQRPGELILTFGMFFDGTKNNMYHTEIRKKAQDKGEFKGYAQQGATEEEKEARAQEVAKDKVIYKRYEIQESFGNDFTNVARQYYNCEEEYRIYVEGIGTVSKDTEDKTDDDDGYIYGRGVTGITEKVRSGCKMLAKKIAQRKAEVEQNRSRNEKTTQIHLIVDVFGFSRGAAAARHFLHTLQKRAYKAGYKVPNVVTYMPEKGLPRVDYLDVYVKDSWMKDDYLPPLGLLGTALLEAKIPRELIENMCVRVRFVGLYDTVVSFDPKTSLIPTFDKYVKDLHLDDIGRPQRAVHYTSIDEHRKFFSITPLNTKKLPNAIELSFPGVHSDIGGSYNHDPFTDEELAEATKNAMFYRSMKSKPTPRTSEYEKIYLDNIFFFKNLELFKKELIREGWFFDDQIVIRTAKLHSLIPFLQKQFSLYLMYKEEIRELYEKKIDSSDFIRFVYSERILERGYSFIPLHFMCEDAKEYIPELDFTQVLEDYALNDFFLEKVKEYLQEHTIEKGEKWVLRYPQKQTGQNPYTFIEEDEIKEEEDYSGIEGFEVNEDQDFSGEAEELGGIDVEVYRPDYLLRKLRNRYLHCSARVNNFEDWAGHRSTGDRRRRVYN